MGLRKSSVVPRILRAMNRFFLVIEAEISEDLRFRWIGRANFRPAMNHSMGLIEIRCARDIWRNHAVIRAEALHAVDLNSKQNGNSTVVELARQLDHCRTAPAMAVKNDARLPLFVFGK